MIALRSQFNIGFDFLDATVNDVGPDSQFFHWQGQGQFVRALGPNWLVLLRGGVQLSTDSLLSLEQFGIGGQSTVRGYRQDRVLTDNGAIASLEMRIPIFRDHNTDTLLQLTPFIDYGRGWNYDGNNPDTNELLGVGTGLLFTFSDRVTARFDWGIPLIEDDLDKDTLQEQGLYFTVGVSLF